MMVFVGYLSFEQTWQGFAIGVAVVILVIYPLLIFPLMRRRLRSGRRVEFTDGTGRIRRGLIDRTPGFGIGLSVKTTVRVREGTELFDVPYKKVKPLKE